MENYDYRDERFRPKWNHNYPSSTLHYSLSIIKSTSVAEIYMSNKINDNKNKCPFQDIWCDIYNLGRGKKIPVSCETGII